MKELFCERCAGQIKIRPDLVTAFYFFRIELYHDECYAKSLKDNRTLFLSNEPINGTAGNFRAGGITLVGLAFPWLTNYPFYIAIPFFIPLAIRLYSWFRFEKHLEP